MKNYKDKYNVPLIKSLSMTLGIVAFSFRSFVSFGMTILKAYKAQDNSQQIKSQTIESAEEEEYEYENNNDENDEKYNEVIKTNGQMALNNGLIYLGIPHDFKFPPKILYISLKSKGSYDESIKKFLTLLFKILAMLILIHGSKALMEIVVSVMSIIGYKTFIKGKENDFLAICEKAWIYVNEKKTKVIPIVN